jgi:vacuolar-type H+-ATPase subunit F/Vma7
MSRDPGVQSGTEAGDPAAPETRLIAMGSAELTLGFRLIGFETYPDASAQDVEHLLNDLLVQREKALVLLEPELARSDSPALERVRREGGHIVITEVPSLHAPEDYHPVVEDVVRSVLGPGALEEFT